MRLPLFAAALITGLLAFAGCSKDDENECTDCMLLGYTQTQCTDPWGYGADGSDVAVEYAVRDFFASNGVVINTVSIYGTAEPVTTCTACQCPTGKSIYVLVNSADSAAFTGLGFFK